MLLLSNKYFVLGSSKKQTKTNDPQLTVIDITFLLKKYSHTHP